MHTPVTPAPPVLHPEHEVRARLGLSRTTWFRLRRDGAAPEHVLIGHRRYYRPEAVEAWLAGRTARAA